MGEDYNEYKLSCNVIGHEKDVRSLHAINHTEPSDEGNDNSMFISGSRDLTMKAWGSNRIGLGYHEFSSVRPSKEYVSAVCYAPSSDLYPNGYILTGCKDGTMKAFELTSTSEQIFTVKHHSDNLCSLDATSCGSIVSSSWDNTACVMINDTLVDTLKGHEAAVWCSKVIAESGFIITASADRTIKIWKGSKCLNTLTGHTDCVRGISIVNSDEFLSCSNDSTVRRWNVDTGICTKVYYGHTNYVYSVICLSKSLFASCGEDRSVRIWSHSDHDLKQTICLPAQSLWSISSFANGNFVVGSSDSMIRMFSCIPRYVACTEDLSAFEQAVTNSEILRPAEQIDASTLPSIDSGLLKPGKKEGDVRMVNENNVAIAFQWSAGKWQRIGSIVGANKNKTMYNGKEYDFVFDVDIAEGIAPLKLPYNLEEDVWTASQLFIDRHNLNPVYLEEIVNFLQARISESGKHSTGSAPVSAYQDPLTGAGRYIPDASEPSRSSGALLDPYTGSGRYVPDGSVGNGEPALQDPFTGSERYVPTGSVEKKTTLKSNEYFPVRTFLLFTDSRPSLISDKIQSFNNDLSKEIRIVIDINEMCTGLSLGVIKPEYIEVPMKCLKNWPIEKVFPILDLLRIASQFEEAMEIITANENFREISKVNIMKISGPNSYIMLRIYCNMFNKESGRIYLLNMMDEIVKLISCYLASVTANKNMEIAIATLVLNYAIMGKNKEMDLLIIMKELIKITKNDEAKFRLLVTIGTLINNSEIVAMSIKGAGFAKFVQSCSEDIDSSCKTSACAKYLIGFI